MSTWDEHIASHIHPCSLQCRRGVNDCTGFAACIAGSAGSVCLGFFCFPFPWPVFCTLEFVVFSWEASPIKIKLLELCVGPKDPPYPPQPATSVMIAQLGRGDLLVTWNQCKPSSVSKVRQSLLLGRVHAVGLRCLERLCTCCLDSRPRPAPSLPLSLRSALCRSQSPIESYSVCLSDCSDVGTALSFAASGFEARMIHGSSLIATVTCVSSEKGTIQASNAASPLVVDATPPVIASLWLQPAVASAYGRGSGGTWYTSNSTVVGLFSVSETDSAASVTVLAASVTVSSSPNGADGSAHVAPPTPAGFGVNSTAPDDLVVAVDKNSLDSAAPPMGWKQPRVFNVTLSDLPLVSGQAYVLAVQAANNWGGSTWATSPNVVVFDLSSPTLTKFEGVPRYADGDGHAGMRYTDILDSSVMLTWNE
jgi:hypothetical protein